MLDNKNSEEVEKNKSKEKDFLKYIKDFSGKLTRLQEELACEVVEVEVGGGLVKVLVNGNKEIVKIIIDEELLEIKDKKMLEELIKAGVNEALKRSHQLILDEYMKLSGGLFKFPLNIP